jgi:hypothetical protein
MKFLTGLFNSIPSIIILLPKSDLDLLKKKCQTMMVTPEQYVANLIAIDVRPKDKGFRVITRGGILIDSKGKDIGEYLKETLKDSGEKS